MAEKWLTKLSVAGSHGDEYFLFTTARNGGEEGFHLVLSNIENTWKTIMDENDLETLSEQVKMDYSDFVRETKKAFTRVGMGKLNFLYQTKQQKNGSMLLTWKKHIETENIRIQLGSVILKPVTDQTSALKTMFEESISLNTELHTTINTLRSEKERAQDERKNALKRLEKYVAAKESLENDLYAKFATVINHKKSKIRALRDGYDGAKGDSVNGTQESVLPSTSTSSKRQRIKPSQEQSSDEEDITANSDYNTDEETEMPAVKRTKRSSPVKHQSAALSKDDSLILDTGIDTMETSSSPVVPRRRREAAKKSSPAKAVLPKVSSTPKASTSRTSSRTATPSSMKKSTSNSSNISSDNIPDASDMIDDMF